jgi:MFS family permease
MVAMFFGMPMVLFPAIAKQYGGAEVLGLLYAAPSVGALVASLTSGWAARVHRHGMAIIWAAGSWGLAVAVFGLVTNLWVALFFLALAGAADMISGIFRGTLWNQTIPDRLRGRLAGIEQVSYSSGPLLGNLESGVVAALFSVRASVVSGGVLCVVGVGLFALFLPAFRHYDSRVRLRASPSEGAL